MRKIIIIPLSVLLLAGPLMAQDLEGLRKSSGGLEVNVSGLKAAASAQADIAPVPDQGLAGLVSSLLKLLFSPNGDIEVASAPAAAPQVDGVMQDDESEERYDANVSYAPMDPSEYQDQQAAGQPGQFQRLQTAGQPRSRKDFQEFLHPGRASASGAVPEDLKRKALAFFSANADKIRNKRYVGAAEKVFCSLKSRR